jgi:hypothetical protein
MVVVGPVPAEEREHEIWVGIPERRDGCGEAHVGERAREECPRERDQVGSMDQVASTRASEAARVGAMAWLGLRPRRWHGSG